jgi:hypothetical protein
MNYSLTYSDGSPVTTGQYIAYVMHGQSVAGTATLTLANPASGFWTATWVPSPSQDLTSYNFALTPQNSTDAYGNVGQGQTLTSSDVLVTPANLEVTLAAQTPVQRTQNMSIEVIARYHNGIIVANFTQITGNLIGSNGEIIPLHLSVTRAKIVGTLRIPANANLGQWTVNLSFKDIYGNPGSTQSKINLIPPILVFKVNFPNSTERTTFLNVTATVAYPDSTPLTSGVKLEVSFWNRTWTPELSVNSTTGVWAGQLYIPQDSALGVYSISLTAHDNFGNEANYTAQTRIIPAKFRIAPNGTNSTVEVFDSIDLPVAVAYPNGTTLDDSSGFVNAFYMNSTGTPVNLPLSYNATDARWHMYFTPTQEGTFNFTFSAVDRFGNSGVAPDAYRVIVNPTNRSLAQNLILAAVIGTLVPIALLIWAIVTISTRRRKHRP